MKAICKVRCQKNRQEVFEEGKEYEISEEMFKSGFWQKAEKKESKESK